MYFLSNCLLIVQTFSCKVIILHLFYSNIFARTETRRPLRGGDVIPRSPPIPRKCLIWCYIRITRLTANMIQMFTPPQGNKQTSSKWPVETAQSCKTHSKQITLFKSWTKNAVIQMIHRVLSIFTILLSTLKTTIKRNTSHQQMFLWFFLIFPSKMI